MNKYGQIWVTFELLVNDFTPRHKEAELDYLG